jgi:hypothetical protein
MFHTRSIPVPNPSAPPQHVGVMVFVIIAGFCKADPDNFKPFFPNDQPDQWKQVRTWGGVAGAFGRAPSLTNVLDVCRDRH